APTVLLPTHAGGKERPPLLTAPASMQAPKPHDNNDYRVASTASSTSWRLCLSPSAPAAAGETRAPGPLPLSLPPGRCVRRWRAAERGDGSDASEPGIRDAPHPWR